MPDPPHFGVYLASRTTFDRCCDDWPRWVCYYTLVGFFVDGFLRVEGCMKRSYVRTHDVRSRHN